MNPIRIREVVGSTTLYLPELEPLIGRWVRITIEEEPVPAVRDEFWAEAARLPETEEEFEAKKALYRTWRSDPRFEPYWQVLDGFMEIDLAHIRKWAAIESQLPIEDYDYGARRAQEECDMEDARRHMS
jgi:hypothetical protein